MNRFAVLPFSALLILGACTWPPTLPSTPNPGQAVNDATNPATTALPAAQVPAVAVPRVSVPPVSVPRLGRGALLR